MKISELRQALDIFEKHGDGAEDVIACAEHDEIYSGFSDEKIPEDSEDGKKLQGLGWHVSEECWCKFV